MNATWQGFTDRVTAEFGKVAMVDVRPLVTAAEDPLPTTELSNRHSKLQRTKAAEIERMTRAKWRQAAKDVPVAILAGGLGYGIGRTLTELIGKHVVASGGTPPWLKAMPAGLAIAGAAGGYFSAKSRASMKERREAAK